MDFQDWLNDIATDEYAVFVKRLSANDTGLTGSHQVGTYVPKETLKDAFPSFRGWKGTPKVSLLAAIESHNMPEKEVTATFYESKNEGRITSWVKGAGNSPMQDSENTGALTVFAFFLEDNSDCRKVRVWICKGLNEEELFENIVHPVDPDTLLSVQGGSLFNSVKLPSEDTRLMYPEEWGVKFPSGREIIDFLHESRKYRALPPDRKVIRSREDELNLFLDIEKKHILPIISAGFGSVADFIDFSNSVLNRRKSRSGKSLELHLERIFQEEGLTHFGVQCVTEGKKKPDFLFPGCKEYKDLSYPANKLRSLAVKTTLKDRWRQVLNEADRITEIYLFTLQRGVSPSQFQEMEKEGVVLVVPKGLHESYPDSIRPKLLSLSEFIDETKKLYIL